MTLNKVLIDTNICIDAALNRRPFAADALKIINYSEENIYTGIITAHSFDTIFYLLRSNHDLSRIYTILDGFLEACMIADVTESIIYSARQLNWPDFEDAIHYQAAIATGSDAIITRNEQDFAEARLPVLSPSRFLEELDI